MNLDERIKQELETDTEDMDKLVNDKIRLAVGMYQGQQGRWMRALGVVLLLISAVMVWTGVEFFLSNNLDERVFWGVCFLASLVGQISIKQWWWMSTNQNAMMREIKRMELALEKRVSTN